MIRKGCLKKSVVIILMISMVINLLSGCGNMKDDVIVEEKKVSVDSGNLMGDLEKNDIAPIVLTGEETETTEGIRNFAANVFVESYESGKNTLVSPISILYALGMTANGANGETLEQMECVLGDDIDSLNEYLYAYKSGIETWTKLENAEFYLANAIWFKDDEQLQVNESFLQTNKDYYDASIYEAPFDDSTLNDINNWTYNATNGMIEKILERIPENAVMYLVNGLAFEAKWDEIYEETSVHDGTFTTEEGVEQEVEYLYSNESMYIEGTQETGFVKLYEGGDFAFVGLLPNEGVGMDDYIATLNGEKLGELLATRKQESVQVSMPKIEVEYDTNLKEVLMNLGMVDCFDGNVADFHRLGSYTGENILIDRILHKTYLAVDEQGTKAGAVTAVEMITESACEVMNRVWMERPYVYMIVDMHEEMPLFIGCVTSVEEVE